MHPMVVVMVVMARMVRRVVRRGMMIRSHCKAAHAYKYRNGQ